MIYIGATKTFNLFFGIYLKISGVAQNYMWSKFLYDHMLVWKIFKVNFMKVEILCFQCPLFLLPGSDFLLFLEGVCKKQTCILLKCRERRSEDLFIPVLCDLNPLCPGRWTVGATPPPPPICPEVDKASQDRAQGAQRRDSKSREV
jgi:hypothetical protein